MMNERERILDLVKQGVLTSEEALVLLENLTKRKAAEENEKPAAASKPTEPTTDEEPDQEAADAALTAINTALAEAAGKLDAKTAQAKKLTHQLHANEDQIIVIDTMEDLDTLTAAKAEERQALKQQNQQLAEQKAQLVSEIETLKAQVTDLTRQKRQLMKQHFTDKVLPDDWQEQAKDLLTDLTKTVGDATTQIGAVVKKTVNTVLDNVDWKDVKVRVPGLATEKFNHVFTYENSKATILDIKVANGDVTLRTSDTEDIVVDANIKLFGRMSGETPLAAFIERSRIDVNADHFIFQVPNQRIQADLVITLPKRLYDHVNIRLLNGAVALNDLEGKDLYVKNANGDQVFTDLNATLLETQGVNGSLAITGGQLRGLRLETVNGDIKVHTTPQKTRLQTVNGTVKVLFDHDFEELDASTVNGNLKLAVPKSVAVEGEIKTRFGTVTSALQGVAPAGKAKHLALDRAGTGTGHVTVTTTSGSVTVEDVED